jgi:serine O-acetyltransferase
MSNQDNSTPLDLSPIVGALHAARDRWRGAHPRSQESGGRSFPSRDAINKIMAEFRGALFPMRLGPADLRLDGEDFYVGHTLSAALTALRAQIRLELENGILAGDYDAAQADEQASAIVRDFAESLPELRAVLDSDVEAAYEGDPAARSVDEVLLCYPGITAIIHYRLAHCLHGLGAPLVARMVTEIAHSATGIDIHPGAKIGGSFFIDHGTGVVIGETAVIGRRVRIYQAVTLGAKSFPRDTSGRLTKGLPRHPIVEDDVVIYAGATILGPVTIGKGSTIGGNVWLIDGVPPGSHVNQATTRQEPVRRDKQSG